MNFRKLLTYLTVGTAAVIPFAGAQNPTILQGSYISNVFGNSNFVLNPNAQTNVANVTNATRVTTTPLVATSEFNLNLTSGTFATWALRAFDSGMKGQNCEARFSYRGFATATTKAEIVQNSLVVAHLVLTPSTDPRIASINFPCGDLANATTFRIAQTTANMTIVTPNEIGGIYVGLATNMANVAQASKVGGFDNMSCSSEAGLTAGALVSFLAPNVAGTCTGTAVGLASAGSSNLNTLTFQFNNLPPGEYVLLAPVYVYPTSVSAGSARCDGRIRETTLNLIDGGNAFSRASTTEFLSIGSINQFKFQNPTTGNRIFQIEFNRHLATSNCNGGFLNFQQNVSLYRFPSSSELVVTPERQNTFAGLLGYSASSTNAVTSSSWTKLTASATLNRELFGKADTTASNDLSLTIKNLPVGTYEIKTSGAFQAQANAAADATFCTFGISDLSSPTNPLGATQVSSYGDASVTQPTFSGGAIVAIYKNTSVADRTFTLFAKRLAGSGNCSAITIQADRPISITITPLDQPSNSALYVQGPVLGSQTGAAIPAGYQFENFYGSEYSGSYVNGGWLSLASTTLTPGLWQVEAACMMRNNTSSATTGWGFAALSISNNTADQGTITNPHSYQYKQPSATTLSQYDFLNVKRIIYTTTTTLRYMNIYSSWASGGAPTYNCQLFVMRLN